MILFPCAHAVRVLVCSKYIFLPFQPFTHYQLSLQVRGLWLIFFQSPLTSLLSWTTEQTKMPRALTAPNPFLTYKLRNMLSLGSVLHSGNGKASPHLPKFHRQQRPMLYLSLLSSAKKVWQVNNRKHTWIIYTLSLITQHRGVLPPVQGALKITGEVNAAAHRTKPAFATGSEPMGEFHTILYLPVRRHTYRMADMRQLDAGTAIVSGILKKNLEKLNTLQRYNISVIKNWWGKPSLT